MAIRPNAFAEAFIKIGLEDNKAGFNLRFRLLQNAYIRKMNKEIQAFNTPSAPERQKEASLNTELKKLGVEQAQLTRYVNDVKININHMRKVANALTVMSESRTPVDARVKTAVKFHDNTPDDVIRAAPGSFSADLKGEEIRLKGAQRSGAENGLYLVKSVSADGSEISVQKTDTSDAGFPDAGVPAAKSTPARAKLDTPPAYSSGKKEMAFRKDADGNNLIEAAPGTFNDLENGDITVRGAGAHNGKYKSTSVSEDGSTITVTKKSGRDAGFSETGVTESAATVKSPSPLDLDIGPGGMTFIDGGDTTGDDSIEAAPGAFEDFKIGDTIRIKYDHGSKNREGDLRITGVSDDGSTVTVQSLDGDAAELVNEDSSTIRDIRREPILGNMAFNDSDRIRERKKAGLDDSIIAPAGTFSGLSAGDSVVLYSNSKSKNKGEFLVTSVNEDGSEIFVRSPNNDDAGLVRESGGYLRTMRKKTASSTVSPAEVNKFNAGRAAVLKHLHAMQQLSHADLSDFGEASRIKSLIRDFKSMELKVGEVGQTGEGTPEQASYDIFEKIGKVIIRLSNAQLLTGGILTSANKVAGTISRKSRQVQSKLHDMTGLQQAEAASDIQKLRQRYATLLDAISIGYDAQAKGYSELALALGPRKIPPGSVLNMFS